MSPGQRVTPEQQQATLGGSPSAPSRRGPRRAALGLIRIYQLARAGRPSPCRFVPSCSAYAMEAVDRYGVWRGGWLAVRRIARCRPGGGRGYDPVPEPEELRQPRGGSRAPDVVMRKDAP
ncbi:membrane protein insertion efficiency factor YidD [Aciditerrimonas ferrireducens]|uniref:Putative membrane protein insertion efficiency factor n=1 Tax=Aciditerrimonas ferrireducens TaxID=667306 RepID=A0ABV6C2U8_9ACTN|nr:membrane protein insertion efficiency factor YidD [Aciditerrimonas ferrireducens]